MIPEIELRSLEDQKAYQESRLSELLTYVKTNAAYYNELFEKHNIKITEIKTLEDLQQIPVTQKVDIQKRNQDFICVNQEKIIDYVTTSGTLGDPITFPLTDADLERLAYNEYISIACANGSEKDI